MTAHSRWLDIIYTIGVIFLISRPRVISAVTLVSPNPASRPVYYQGTRLRLLSSLYCYPFLSLSYHIRKKGCALSLIAFAFVARSRESQTTSTDT